MKLCVLVNRSLWVCKFEFIKILHILITVILIKFLIGCVVHAPYFIPPLLDFTIRITAFCFDQQSITKKLTQNIFTKFSEKYSKQV